MPLKIAHTEKKPGCYEVTLAGRLDTETSAQLQSLVAMLFQNPPVRALQLHLRDVDYVSSAGLRAILLAMKQTRNGGGAFMVVEMQAPVKKVFEIAQMIPMNSIFASVKEADDYFDTIQKRERERSAG